MKKILATMLLAVMLITLLPVQSVQAATYQNGSKGTKVEYLQRNLTFLGFSTKGTDGDFGNNTRKAVVDLQKALGFVQTGIVDEELYSFIQNTVADVQRYLKAKGYYNGVIDGISGNGTVTALKSFQKDIKSAYQGYADYFTLKKIVDDTSVKVETKNLREWVARLNGTFGKTLNTYYYSIFGEDYLTMYKEYPEALALIGSYLGMLGTNSYAMQVYRNEISGIDGDVFGTVVKDGFNIVMDEFLSFFGISKGMGEQIRYDAVMKMVRDLYQDKSVTTEIIDEIETGFADMKKIYSTAEKGAKAVLIADLAKSSSALSYETIEEIVDSILGENSAGIMKYLDAGTTIVDYIKTTVQLYELDGELLIHLQKTVGENTQLYKDIDILLAERKQNPMAFFAKQFLTDAAKEAVGQALNSVSGGLYGIVTDNGEALMGLVGGASVQEQAYAVYLATYYSELGIVLDTMRQDFKDNADVYLESELAMCIEEYEFILNAYKSSLGSFYDSVYAMASDGAKAVIQGEIDYLDSLTMEDCISMCIKQMERLKERESETTAMTVQEKMDLLLEKLGVQNGSGVYFTVDQKACSTVRLSGHGCTNCNMRDIVQTTWFKNLFGTVNVDNFPEHDVNSTRRDHTGQACFGFACFAQWYLFKADNSSAVTASRVAEGPFNKEFMKTNVQPGDVLRLVNSDTDAHSVVVYSVEDTGIYVIDSNWSNKLNCYVQKHWISYTDYYARAKVYVNRVTDVVTGTENVELAVTPVPTVTPAPQLDNKQYGTLDLSSTTWSSYNAGLDKDMNADKAYNIKDGAKLEVLGEYTNAKGNKVYHVYSFDLQMECYIGAKYVRVDYADKEVYGALELSSKGWDSYNAGMDKNMNADKAYNIPNGGKVKVLAKHVNDKENDIYEVYSYDLDMVCYIAAKYVKLN